MGESTSVVSEDGSDGGGGNKRHGKSAVVKAEVIDVPGHQSMRQHGFDLVEDADVILYILDGTDKVVLKEAAEHLYDLWLSIANDNAGHDHYSDKPMLLCINKCERLLRGPKHIKEDIEREVERLRQARSIGFEGDHAADSYLG